MKQVNKLTPTEAAYIAGIVDGEAHLDINGGKPRLTITQAEISKHILYFVKDAVGAGSVYLDREAIGNWQARYRYQLRSHKMVPDLMGQLKPYLLYKKIPK